MGRKKEKTKQVTVRLPESLHKYVSNRAGHLYGGDFTSALIELLFRAKELILKHEKWIAEREILEWAKVYEEQKREAEGAEDTGTDPPRGKGD